MRAGIRLRKSSSHSAQRRGHTSNLPLGAAGKRVGKKHRRSGSQYLQPRSRHCCTDVAMDVDGVHPAQQGYRSRWSILESDEIDGAMPEIEDGTSAAEIADVPLQDASPGWADENSGDVPPAQTPGRKKRSRMPDVKKMRLYTRWDQLLPLLRIPLASYIAGKSTPSSAQRCQVAGCCLRTREVVCVFWKRKCSIFSTAVHQRVSDVKCACTLTATTFRWACSSSTKGCSHLRPSNAATPSTSALWTSISTSSSSQQRPRKPSQPPSRHSTSK